MARNGKLARLATATFSSGLAAAKQPRQNPADEAEAGTESTRASAMGSTFQDGVRRCEYISVPLWHRSYEVSPMSPGRSGAEKVFVPHPLIDLAGESGI